MVLRLRALVQRKGGDQQALGRIHTSTRLTDVRDAGFIVENVTEQWSIKRTLYEQLDAICPTETILAANTSVISITADHALDGSQAFPSSLGSIS